ncbi:MAG: hypothetical protein ACRCYV_02905 [Aeromonas sp.]
MSFKTASAVTTSRRGMKFHKVSFAVLSLLTAILSFGELSMRQHAEFNLAALSTLPTTLLADMAEAQ